MDKNDFRNAFENCNRRNPDNALPKDEDVQWVIDKWNEYVGLINSDDGLPIQKWLKKEGGDYLPIFFEKKTRIAF